MGIIMHRGGLPSPGTSLDSPGSSDCTYTRLYPDATAMKTYERPVYHEPKSTYDLSRPVWVNEAAKYPVDHSTKPYEPTARSYAEMKCHEVAKYHETNTKYHEVATAKYHHETASKYPDLQTKSYDLPKYTETKGYPDSLRYSTEMSGAAKPYTCMHGQYYPAAEGYAVHEENDYQSQSVASHSFYPYISASVTQPPYYMGPR